VHFEFKASFCFSITMKVAVPKSGYSTMKCPPILPLVREDNKKKVTKENSLALTLKVNPGATGANAPTYQMVMTHVHSTETPRETIECVRNIRQAFIGLGINGNNSGGNQRALCERIFKDRAPWMSFKDPSLVKSTKCMLQHLLLMQQAVAVVLLQHVLIRQLEINTSKTCAM
jgi:hypothetical protein